MRKQKNAHFQNSQNAHGVKMVGTSRNW